MKNDIFLESINVPDSKLDEYAKKFILDKNTAPLDPAAQFQRYAASLYTEITLIV